MKYIQQLDITDCGAACIAMIASFYGKALNIAQIRDSAGTDMIGTNCCGVVQINNTTELKSQSCYAGGNYNGGSYSGHYSGK